MKRVLFKLCALALIVFLCATQNSAKAGERSLQARIKVLVEKLGAKEWAEREAATKEFLRIGAPAVPALKAALKNNDPEIRERAKLLLEELGPIAALASSDRSERIVASHQVCNVAEQMIKTRAAKSASMYTAAVRGNPELLNSRHILSCIRSAADNLDDAGRANFSKSDLGLFLANRSQELEENYPSSPLAEKLVYNRGKFDEYLRRFPEGYYAPHARYCLISGRKSYAIPENKWGSRMRMTDPDREIRAWPEFLDKYADFAGADDANYRYARALEKKGRLVEACLRLRLKFPDDDMREESLERMLFVMDAKMSAAQLGELAGAVQRKERGNKESRVGRGDLAVLTKYLIGLRLMRDGGFRQAARQFGAVSDQQESTLSAFLRTIVGQSIEKVAHCKKAAALAEKPDGDKLYKLASLIYKGKKTTFRTGIDCGRLSVSSYYDSMEPADFFRKRSKYWQAAQIYEKVVSDYPDSKSVPKAIYMLGNCYCHMADKEAEGFWRRRKENVKKAVGYYSRFARAYPDHELADDARKAVSFLTKKWRLKK